MTLLVRSARVSYGGEDRLDITRSTGSTLGRAFAPTWKTLRPAIEARQDADALRRAGDVARADAIDRAAWETYVPLFLAEMRVSFVKWRPAWTELLARERVVLVCYCSARDAAAGRCHRVLLRTRILPALGAQDGGEITP